MPKRKLHIAQISTASHPIALDQNKAIYSHIAQLTEGFSQLGNSVTLFGHKDSKTSAKIHDLQLNYKEDIAKSLARYEQWSLISDCFLEARKGTFDIIHSHVTVMTGLFSRLEKETPTLISVHSPIEEWMKPILLKHKDEKYISFSLAQREQLPELNWYANIYHGIDTELFAFNESPDDYILFLGRITHDKGVHVAIQSCIEAGENLKIAGRSYGSETYWHEQVEPYINGKNIRYVGEVSLEEKIPLIQNAKAIVFPTFYREAFGYVLIEAMSCGTPVIAFPNGSVTEIVRDGKTGFLVNSEEEMVEALKKIDTIDRNECRKRAELFFSQKKMVKHYESVYRRVLQENEFKKNKKLSDENS